MSTTATEAAADPFAGLQGHVRADGRVGLRNHLLILSAVALTDRWAALVAAAFPGALLVTCAFQRGLRGNDAARAEAVIAALATHPNTGAALVLTMDAPAARALAARLAGGDSPAACLALLEQDGMEGAVQAACAVARDLDARRRIAQPQPVGPGALALALECGGSDPTSALAANPAIGVLVDRVVAAGGTAIASETVEFIGAEGVVAPRCPDPVQRDRMLAAIARREGWHRDDGVDYRGTNPTPENIAGGLTTLVEKSLGAVVKTGQGPFAGALDFAEAPPRPGLYFMDTPFFTPASLTGMVAAGCNAVLFALGQFNPSASPMAPTLKVCGNPGTLARWGGSLDVDLCDLVTGAADAGDGADRIARALVRVSAGEATASERWGEGQVIVPTTVEPL